MGDGCGGGGGAGRGHVYGGCVRRGGEKEGEEDRLAHFDCVVGLLRAKALVVRSG